MNFQLYETYVEKSKIVRLKNIDLLPFYEELSVVKTNKAFRGFATTYKVVLINKKDHL